MKGVRKPLKRCLYLELRDLWEKGVKKNDNGSNCRKRCTTEDAGGRNHGNDRNSNMKKNMECKDSSKANFMTNSSKNRQKRMNTTITRT